jgi:hypothetical protein
MKRAALFFLFAALMCGCASVDISDAGGRRMVSIKNSGWELFSIVPLASGDVNDPGAFGCEWFCDTVTLENNLALLDRTVGETGSSGYTGVASSVVDETVFFVLLSRKIYHTSAELLPGDGNVRSGAGKPVN